MRVPSKDYSPPEAPPVVVPATGSQSKSVDWPAIAKEGGAIITIAPPVGTKVSGVLVQKGSGGSASLPGETLEDLGFKPTTKPPRPKNLCERPKTAPNGEPWPAVPAYLNGYPRENTAGRTSVTVDNSRNDTDVFVILTPANVANRHGVRYFYIPRGGTFTASGITPGEYDVWSENLGRCSFSRSDSFLLEEIKVADGVEVSHMTLTLYKVLNGNMKDHPMSEEAFLNLLP